MAMREVFDWLDKTDKYGTGQVMLSEVQVTEVVSKLRGPEG